MAKSGNGRTANGGTNGRDIKSSPAQKRIKNENNRVKALENELKKLFPRSSPLDISKFARSPIGGDCTKELSKANRVDDLKSYLYKNWDIWPKEIIENFRNTLPLGWSKIAKPGEKTRFIPEKNLYKVQTARKKTLRKKQK